MKTKLFTLLSLCLILFSVSCKKKSTRVVDTPQQGTITIQADESFKSVAEALTDRYMALYPETKLELEIKKEDLAFLDLLERKTRVIIMSRDLTDEEKDAYKAKIDLDLQPAPFAADAAVFVVPKDDSRESISVDEIKRMLTDGSKKVIFDGTNSSNLNFVAQKLNTKTNQLQFSIVSGNKNVIQQLNQFPGYIGVVSLNTLSRPYDPDSESLRNNVKILKVEDRGKMYEPTLGNLAEMSYPFTRVLYFLTNEPYFGLGNGFIRFSCTQLGQIVVGKEGLQPYNIFRREVQMR